MAVRDTAQLEGPVGPEVLEAISVSKRIETEPGPLDLADEEPASETVPKVYDHHDSVHAVHVFLDAFAGTSTQAIREGGFISRATRS